MNNRIAVFIDNGYLSKVISDRKAVHDELLMSVDERYEMDDAFFNRIKRDVSSSTISP